MVKKDSSEKKPTKKTTAKKIAVKKAPSKKVTSKSTPKTQKPDSILVAIGVFVAVTLLAIALSVSMVLQKSTNSEGAANPVVSEVSVDDDAVLGDANAPITIVEFSDYGCPFCGRHFSQVLPQIKSEYIDSGMVKVVYRDFAFKGETSQNLAASAECAGEKSDADFYLIHDYIFNNPGADLDSIVAFGKSNGLDSTFETCVQNGDMLEEVQADMADAQSYGVNSTPTFFINGEKVVGAQPFEAFKQVIDKQLAELQ